MSDDSERPYKIEGSKVWLSKSAREWAKQHGMTDREMARYLLDCERLGENYKTTGEVGPFE